MFKPTPELSLRCSGLAAARLNMALDFIVEHFLLGRVGWCLSLEPLAALQRFRLVSGRGLWWLSRALGSGRKRGRHQMASER